MNALTELTKELVDLGKYESDIKALNISVNTVDGKTVNVTNIDDIPDLDVEYDSGYGSQNLFGLVLFKDNTWLERFEYDGSEAWDSRTPITVDDVYSF